MKLKSKEAEVVEEAEEEQVKREVQEEVEDGIQNVQMRHYQHIHRQRKQMHHLR